MPPVGIFIRMISTDVPCTFSAIRIPIVFRRLAICATSRKSSTPRIKMSQGVVLFARKRLHQVQRTRCERWGDKGTRRSDRWQRKGELKRVVIPGWFCDDNLMLVAIDNAIGRQGHL